MHARTQQEPTVAFGELNNHETEQNKKHIITQNSS